MTLSSDKSGHLKHSPIIHLFDFFVPKVPSGQHGGMMHGSEGSVDINRNHEQEM